MTELKEKLRTDLTAAMKGRDELVTATLRMALTAIGNEEVAGKEARELSDAEVVQVLTREAKKRREAAEAFANGGRPEQAEREKAEGEVLARYLPAQLSDDELSALVKKAGPVCLLCYERDHTHCHRQMIAEIIEERDGVKVENLVGKQA